MSRGVRCLVVWLGVTVAVTLGVALVSGQAVAAITEPWSRQPFDVVLVRGAAAVAALAGAWVWLVTTVAVTEVVVVGTGLTHAGGPVRRLVLAACGVALVGAGVASPATAAPAQPDHGDRATGSVQAQLLAGLPLPDRASIEGRPMPSGSSGPSDAAGSRPAAHGTPRVSTVVVAPGDSLWSIAAAMLPGDAAHEQVDRRWREIYAANQGAIGPDPDLIAPGLSLTLPPS